MVIKASKATVEADEIVGGTRAKHHQTNTHNAQTRIARGDVELRSATCKAVRRIVKSRNTK